MCGKAYAARTSRIMSQLLLDKALKALQHTLVTQGGLKHCASQENHRTVSGVALSSSRILAEQGEGILLLAHAVHDPSGYTVSG
jgi:hypothetical protein